MWPWFEQAHTNQRANIPGGRFPLPPKFVCFGEGCPGLSFCVLETQTNKGISCRVALVRVKIHMTLNMWVLIHHFWNSGICHEQLSLGLSDWQRKLMMQRHYGPDHESCPMRAMKAPELASGALEEFATATWSEFSRNLLVAGSLPGTNCMTESEKAILLQDTSKALTLVVSILRLKTTFWTQLPWSLAGLACVDEGVSPGS